MGLGIAPIPFLIVKTMVITIDNFDFNDTYELLQASVTVPGTTESNDPWREVYIKKITIGTQVTYDIENNDFDSNYFVEANEKGGTINSVTYYKLGLVYEPNTTDIRHKELTLNIDGSDIKLSDLFFIKVETDGDYQGDISCSLTGDTWQSLYDNFSVDTKGMQYIKELANTCDTPEGMIDYILNKEAIDVAASCGDYSTMIERYNELMDSNTTTASVSSISNYKKCGCNG